MCANSQNGMNSQGTERCCQGAAGCTVGACHDAHFAVALAPEDRTWWHASNSNCDACFLKPGWLQTTAMHVRFGLCMGAHPLIQLSRPG
jgi:hypothetical protein